MKKILRKIKNRIFPVITNLFRQRDQINKDIQILWAESYKNAVWNKGTLFLEIEPHTCIAKPFVQFARQQLLKKIRRSGTDRCLVRGRIASKIQDMYSMGAIP
jgi:hypothetical protein